MKKHKAKDAEIHAKEKALKQKDIEMANLKS